MTDIATQIEIDFAFSGHKKLRCSICGKFLSIEKVGKSLFIPDSEFTQESTEFVCRKCNGK